jgi:hypothetical protein
VLPQKKRPLRILEELFPQSVSKYSKELIRVSSRGCCGVLLRALPLRTKAHIPPPDGNVDH